MAPLEWVPYEITQPHETTFVGRPFRGATESTATASRRSKESFSYGRRIVRVVRVHHRDDALRGEHLGGVRRPGDDRFELLAFRRLELREHVIGEIASRVSAPDADTQSAEFRSHVLDDRPEAVMRAP